MFMALLDLCLWTNLTNNLYIGKSSNLEHCLFMKSFFNYVQKERAIEQEAMKLRDFLSWTKADLHFDLLGSRKLSQIIFSHSYILAQWHILQKAHLRAYSRRSLEPQIQLAWKCIWLWGWQLATCLPNLMTCLVVITRKPNQNQKIPSFNVTIILVKKINVTCFNDLLIT